MSDATALAQLLRLASPMLPVGAYSYSQGMEWAVEQGAVRDEASATGWILHALAFNIGGLEAPVWRWLYEAWQANDLQCAAHWNARFLAARETSELRAESVQMGEALKLVLVATRELDTGPLDAIGELSFPAAFSFAAQGLGVPLRDGLTGYLWAWGENQVSAAMKLVPLGQSSGQRILAKLIGALPAITDRAMEAGEEEFSNFAPGLAIASSRHETQYTRLFRS
ncbi:MAG TPA: urease accessory protein UreF [Burkholderiales bacterium]|nr:urease accessory protein UreF [Burkholderiales bacterium]